MLVCVEAQVECGSGINVSAPDDKSSRLRKQSNTFFFFFSRLGAPVFSPNRWKCSLPPSRLSNSPQRTSVPHRLEAELMFPPCGTRRSTKSFPVNAVALCFIQDQHSFEKLEREKKIKFLNESQEKSKYYRTDTAKAAGATTKNIQQ